MAIQAGAVAALNALVACRYPVLACSSGKIIDRVRRSLLGKVAELGSMRSTLALFPKAHIVTIVAQGLTANVGY